MGMADWLGWWWNRRIAGRGRRRRSSLAGVRPRRVRGRLEILEDRTLLSAALPLEPLGGGCSSGLSAVCVAECRPAAATQDLPVNLLTRGNQTAPAVAMDALGNCVVVWAGYDRTGQADIWAARLDRFGTRLGPDFVVNTHFAGNQIQPAVAVDPIGNFVVVWSGEGQDGATGPTDFRGVFYRRFAYDGTPLDRAERQVATYTRGIQERPAVAMDAAGNFVVTWSGEGRQGLPSGTGAFDYRGVWARRFHASGAPLDRYQVLVNSPASRWTTQEASDVAMDAAGNYLIVWRSERQDAGAWGVYGQRFRANGSRQGGEIHLNRRIYGAPIDPHVALDAQGAAVVVWSGIRTSAYSTHVYARRLDRLGNAIDGGREFIVDSDPNPRTPFLKQQARVAVSPRGDFLITWSSFGQDQANELAPRDDGVYARLLRADGSDYLDPATGLPLGPFRVNATTLGHQNSPDVAMDDAGHIIVVWTGPDADQNGIWARPMVWNPQAKQPVSAGCDQKAAASWVIGLQATWDGLQAPAKKRCHHTGGLWM